MPHGFTRMWNSRYKISKTENPRNRLNAENTVLVTREEVTWGKQVTEQVTGRKEGTCPA